MSFDTGNVYLNQERFFFFNLTVLLMKQQSPDSDVDLLLAIDEEKLDFALKQIFLSKLQASFPFHFSSIYIVIQESKAKILRDQTTAAHLFAKIVGNSGKKLKIYYADKFRLFVNPLTISEFRKEHLPLHLGGTFNIHEDGQEIKYQNEKLKAKQS